MVVRLGLRPWWRRRLVRRALWALLALDLALPAVWFLLKRVGQPAAADSLVTLQLALCFGQVALIGALLVAALLRAGGRIRLPGDGARPEAPARRRFLLDSVAVGLPLVAAGVGVGGVVEAQSPVRLRRIRLELPRLPEALAGLRILHFADVHLWDLVTLDDLERALARAPTREYDLVCVTGDLADDMSQLPRALELIADLKAPLGHYATLGNHEHAMGLDEALDAYASGPVELMRRSGKVLSYRGQPFVLAGIDDLRAEPRRGHRVFYPDQLDGALGPTAPDAFTVLMSHRPSVMPFAAARDVDLVLAGHTHGGQLAVGGTSLLELNGATNWAWGVYRHEGTVMHVTCGLGQWFPFRLGCPPEMVLLELQPAASVVEN
jgi:predicted MPP superfamily phosphohydrolase